jgi:hypothetical protein
MAELMERSLSSAPAAHLTADLRAPEAAQPAPRKTAQR